MLLDGFLRQCRLRPDALALAENDRRLCYADLLRRTQTVAAALQARGIQAGQPVAIHMDRGVDAVIAVFGVLLAGACYVPLDLKNPSSRLVYIVRDAHVNAVLGLGDAPIWLDADLWLNLAERPEAAFIPVDIPSAGLAAILYTSGSTGQPRGVALSHAAITAFAAWAADLLALTPQDRIASSAPLFFDLSTFDLYAVLGAGASLHFLPAKLTLAPARLSAWLSEQAVSGWYTVPSLLAFLAFKGNLSQTSLQPLRFLLFAGEVFPTPALIDLADALPHTALYNFFGPTETNVCCYWPVRREQLQVGQTIPIGQPAAGCELHIHADNGELWVRGPTLASGYWRDGRLASLYNAQGWYASGDRVSLVQGEYYFHGRLGRMLKCSGYRVEPAEIEVVVNAIEGVRDCTVLGIDDPTAGQRPALVMVLEPEMEITEIRKVLTRQLPSYMQPSRYQIMDALPRLPNGKLDYQQLKELLEA
ncbi:AMP-binding protein [Methylomonas methanica]|uniref:Phenylalanine racemase (ATP-hydrolyzing) n=1 Tax=Methylomonas methanica (strain DSM 25384 / MC09) TaxID=857087 RepID=G0A0L5_METMM|nr:AMP-binding protein [Methylomonas methanica]AEF98791.1 Phenylalanine racemase (ATP-hydrolyzing) [Methylomonas methanica MC09]